MAGLFTLPGGYSAPTAGDSIFRDGAPEAATTENSRDIHSEAAPLAAWTATADVTPSDTL
jgi:hypothetical protein